MHAGHRKRMLKKLNEVGDSLTEHELLEVLLYSAYPRINTNAIAHELISTFGSLENVVTSDINSLMSIKGVGENCSAYLNIFGKVLKLSAERENTMPTLFNFLDFKIYLQKRFKKQKKEEFLIFFLDKKHKVINQKVFTSDSDSAVILDMKEFNKLLSLIKPFAVVVAHNHITSNEQPTKADDDSTGSVALLLSVNGVQFYDHIIIADDKAYSYHISGKMSEINRKFNISNISKSMDKGEL